MIVTPRASTAAHVSAVEALLTTALPSYVPVWSWSEALTHEGNLPPQYVLLQVSRRYRPNVRLDAMDTSESRRISVRWVGDTEPNASLIGDKCVGGLEHVAMTVDGRPTTRIQLDPGGVEAVRPDAGMYSGSADLTYTL